MPEASPTTADNTYANIDIAALSAWNSDEQILRALAQQHNVNDAPVERLIAFRNANRPDSRPRYWAVVDFNLHSSHERLFLFDVVDRKLDGFLCAHGIGSEGAKDDGIADFFSNQDGSRASSLGVYVCAETYHGDHGLALRLDGQESTNSHARHRAIVTHGAKYVSPQYVKKYGRIGRSWGCPAIEYKYVDKVINALRGGSLLIAWKG